MKARSADPAGKLFTALTVSGVGSVPGTDFAVVAVASVTVAVVLAGGLLLSELPQPARLAAASSAIALVRPIGKILGIRPARCAACDRTAELAQPIDVQRPAQLRADLGRGRGRPLAVDQSPHCAGQ